jgi:hypothetical protein
MTYGQIATKKDIVKAASLPIVIIAGLLTIETARETRMNEEYLRAKFDLCINEAEKDLQQEEIARAIANLRRANSALSQLFGFEEETENDN